MTTNGSILEMEIVRHQRTHQSKARARSYLLSPPLLPLPPASAPRIRETVHLPILASHKPTLESQDAPPVSLSISEPSLFTSEPKVTLFDRFPHRRHPPLRKRTPQLPFCKLCDPGGRSQSYRPTYTHFSYPIRPAVKLSPTPPRSQSTSATQLGVRRLVFASPLPLGAPQGVLSVRGTPCLPPQPGPSAQPTRGRTQLHVFLPTEVVPSEEVDSESVDEGFMDELDSKVSSLKIHQGTSKPPV
ncbi:uncharacterized protein LOC125285187 [Alosa alosa]|uniref:uncharacterized protein LOC125285187 n=1 Tax=Alosa alosa TaxID=278164 RepID=UPI002015495C|nr:uncharacterized protein LOC125285187 [Alosa alosa]